MKWAELSTADFEALDRNIPVVLNIGAIEQHGPALPVETDSLIGRSFLNSLDQRAADRVLILPQVAVCCSAHHMDFPGSLTVRHETMLHYICDILESVMQHGFRNIVLFNSHGGNLGIGQVILERLGHRYPDHQIFLFTWWQIAARELREVQESPFGGVGHACEFETSLIAHFAPHFLEGKTLPEPKLTPTFSWAEADMLNAPCGHYYRSMKQISGGTGVAGAPQYASAEKGRRIAELVVGKLAQMLDDILKAS